MAKLNCPGNSAGNGHLHTEPARQRREKGKAVVQGRSSRGLLSADGSGRPVELWSCGATQTEPHFQARLHLAVEVCPQSVPAGSMRSVVKHFHASLSRFSRLQCLTKAFLQMPELLCVHGIRQGLSLGSWTLVLPCGALKAECEALLYLGL